MSGHDYDVVDETGKRKRIKDGDIEKYKFVKSSDNGRMVVLQDKDGKTWSGHFVDVPTGAAFNVSAPSTEIANPGTNHYLATYGRYISENQRADGKIPDPNQSRLGRWIFGTTWIDPNQISQLDWLAHEAAESFNDQMGFAIGGVKADIKLINWIVGKEGLSLAQRELLHEEINSITRMGGKITKEEIIDLAKQVKQNYPNK